MKWSKYSLLKKRLKSDLILLSLKLHSPFYITFGSAAPVSTNHSSTNQFQNPEVEKKSIFSWLFCPPYTNSCAACICGATVGDFTRTFPLQQLKHPLTIRSNIRQIRSRLQTLYKNPVNYSYLNFFSLQLMYMFTMYYHNNHKSISDEKQYLLSIWRITCSTNFIKKH